MRYSFAVFIFLLLIPGGIYEAKAVVRGQPAGEISRHVVRLTAPGFFCSATVIGPQEVLTAAHCARSSKGLAVIAGGRRIAVTSASAGAPARLTLAHPLPSSYGPIAPGSGSGAFIIAGYGVAYESLRAPSAGLRQAELVSQSGSAYGTLVDPNRRGEISASACMGDSGGPVAQFDGNQYVLIGIIDRASHSSPHRGCGHLTHFVSVGGTGFNTGGTATDQPRPARPTAKMKKQQKITADDETNRRDR